jgi:hypothetical protein
MVNNTLGLGQRGMDRSDQKEPKKMLGAPKGKANGPTV